MAISAATPNELARPVGAGGGITARSVVVAAAVARWRW